MHIHSHVYSCSYADPQGLLTLDLNEKCQNTV